MTFVAQPFEQFVDELLTAMTGGFIREEHRFEGAELPYPIAAASAIAESVRIVGQSDGAFRPFHRGIDYEYEPSKSLIAWVEGGSVPDDRSFFYVNYYPTEGDRRLTDRNVGSVTRTLAEAFSRQFAVLHKQMELIYRSAFVDLATDGSLDHVAALLDVTRRDSRYATGEVLFKRTTPAPAAIAIPAGTLVSTPEGQNFETTDERRIRRGQLSVTVPIRAREPGPSGSVGADAITVVNEPIFGVEGVLNAENTQFDSERETDAELRRRIKGALERAGGSTRNAVLQTLIRDVPEVNQNNVRMIERVDEPGLVELQFGIAGADADTVARIDEAILRSRAAGVRVVHNLGSEPSPSGTSPEQTGAHGETAGRTSRSPTPEQLAELPDGVLPLRIEVLYRLADPSLSPSERDELEDAMRERIVAYVDQLSMDDDLIYSKLVARAVEPETVADAMVRIGVTGDSDLSEDNLTTAGRKAMIVEPQHDVFVGPMREVVQLDVRIAVEPSENGTSPDPGRWERAVQDALVASLGSATPAQLTTDDVARVARVAIEASPYRMGQDPVSINASFEESGRFLAGPRTVDLARHQHVVFRAVTLDVASPLDG